MIKSYEEIIKLNSEALAVMHLAYMEDFGISPIEGIASGKPIITVEPAGYLEVVNPIGIKIKDSENEYLLVERVAEAIEEIYKNEEKYIESAKYYNRKEIEKKDLTWKTFARKMDWILNRIVEKYRVFR